jgi:hypothetical protein
VPIRGDGPAHVLRWEGGQTTEAYRYDAVRLRLEVVDGTIYSIEI